MFAQCWANVYDAGPTLPLNRVNVVCLLCLSVYLPNKGAQLDEAAINVIA